MSEDQTRKQYNDGMWKMSRKAFDRHEIRTRGDGRWMIQRRNERPEDSDAAGNKGWTWIMGAEIVCMGHQAIAVVGDIDSVVFAHGGNDYLGRIFWMGRSTSLGYIQEKAHIGMSSGELVESYEAEVARTDLESRIRDRLEELSGDTEVAAQKCPGCGSTSIEQTTKGVAPGGPNDNYAVCGTCEWEGVVDDLVGQLTLDDQVAAILEDPEVGADHDDVEIRAYSEACHGYTEDGSNTLFQHLYDQQHVQLESESIYSIGMVVSLRVFYAHAAIARLAELLTLEDENGQGDKRG